MVFNISSCTSQNSTAIISSNMDRHATTMTTTTTLVVNGRALDRHNPIITPEKQSEISSKSGTPFGTPHTNHLLQQKPKTKNKPNNTTLIKTSNNTKNIVTDENHHKQLVGRKSFCKPSDVIMKAGACKISKPGVDYITPQESSRYLLDDTSLLDVTSDFDPVLKLSTYNSTSCVSKNVEVSKFDASSKLTHNPSSSSSGSSEQLVVLSVSLHCRGCETKLKKHLSTMSGVTSFNIDFAAKKVTVVGDMTPSQVLASISKVKTAKFWSTTMPFNTTNKQVATK